MTNYSTYSERKLYGELNATRAIISKLQSEKERLDKKIEKTTRKENAIKQALIQRLMPNDATIDALNNATSIGVFDNFDEAKKALMSDD
ncbi:hypothetical protein LS71_009315 [Helicobacter jaachi]|uniref:Uncharacterized protein n=1 Tax=Helicobacter jaachi TaxID=1677920 RepID=A0A4U8T4W3_9HELI|nr:hypothetical protein [Helicobacter jaachi]TLD94494.1 hypothetical protein LS71_009315 [Helicobacter jaachi]